MKRKTNELPGIGKRAVPYYSSALRDCRVTGGFDQSQLAQQLGISRVHVSRIETGSRVPSTTVLTEWLSTCGQGERVDITLDVLTHAPRSMVAAQSGLTLTEKAALLTSPAVDDIVNIMRDEPGHAYAIQVSQSGRQRIRDVLERALLTVVNHAIGCTRSRSAEYSAAPTSDELSEVGDATNTKETE